MYKSHFRIISTHYTLPNFHSHLHNRREKEGCGQKPREKESRWTGRLPFVHHQRHNGHTGKSWRHERLQQTTARERSAGRTGQGPTAARHFRCACVLRRSVPQICTHPSFRQIDRRGEMLVSVDAHKYMRRETE